MRISFGGSYTPYIPEDPDPDPTSYSYLSIRNSDENTESPGIWFNFPESQTEVYYEYLAVFHNIDLIPLINASPGALFLECVPMPDPPGVTFLFDEDSVGWSSVGYENDDPRRMTWGTTDGAGGYVTDGPTILTDVEYLIQGRLTYTGVDGSGNSMWEHELRVDGISIGIAVGFSGPTMNSVSAMLLYSGGQGPGSSGCESRYKHVKIGLGWSGSEIFEANYASGDVTTVPGPWTNYYVADPITYPGVAIEIIA